jgi:hypothetical protein
MSAMTPIATKFSIAAKCRDVHKQTFTGGTLSVFSRAGLIDRNETFEERKMLIF